MAQQNVRANAATERTAAWLPVQGLLETEQ